MALLQVENLTFTYPESNRAALYNLSFSLNEGEFVVLCGTSGCGKSTLLSLLQRELAPHGEQSGRILYNGQPQAELSGTESAKIGLVRQRPETQIVTDKVWHELAFGPESLGWPQQTIRRRVAETASYFGLESVFRKNTAELSGGQKQLLNLAAVSVMQPNLMLLDEPTAQLDPISSLDFLQVLSRLNRELGLTVLAAEHRLEEVLPLADRVLFLDDGKIVWDGPARQFADCFTQMPHHPMACALPAAARIFRGLSENGPCPLTVREGRRFFQNHYRNTIRSLPEEPEKRTGETLLSANGVFFRYEKDSPDILHNLSLSVFSGEHLCLLGGNGAGKSTLIGLLSGSQKPLRGTVLYQGKKLLSLSGEERYHQNIAVLPQDPQCVFTGKTVREDLMQAADSVALNRPEAKAAVLSAGEQFDLSLLQERHPFDLSGGEQQRAALAKLILLKPKLLFLDEPTKGIDAFGKQKLRQILKMLQQAGITLVTVTHDPEFAAETADRCAFLFDGQILSADSPKRFFDTNVYYTTPASRITKGFWDEVVLCEDAVRLFTLNRKKEDGAE